MIRPRIALRLRHLLEHLEPPVLGDLTAFHIGCHIRLQGETVEILSVAHVGGLTYIRTRHDTVEELPFDWPLRIVEPLATVHPIGAK